jgi:competence protein ComEC
MESLMVSISISLVSLPVLLYTFYEISLSGFLLNMIVIPLMSLLVITAFAGGMLSLFLIPSAAFILGSTHYILAFFNILCLIGKSIPFNKIIAGKPSLLQTGIYYFLIVLVIYIVSVNKRTDKLNCMWISFHGDEKRPPFNNYIRLKKKYCFLIVITGILILSYRSHVFKISMLDIGQGDAFVMQNSLGNVYISDCGSTSKKNVGTNILVPFLKSQGISTIDAVFVSHMDEDHVNGVIETLQEPAIRVKNIFISNVYASQVEIIKKGLTGEGVNDNLRCLVTLCNERKIPLYFLKAGDAVKDKKFRFSVLYPMRDTKVDNENDASLIMRLDMSGFSMLFTGDAGEKAESDVISKMNPERVLVLKVGHHGSRFSSSDQFLDAISPKLALISCGKNNRYGHPHEETIEKLGKRGAMIERTDKEGYVEIRKNKGNIALLNHISKNR